MALIALLRHGEQVGTDRAGSPLSTHSRRGLSVRGRAQAEAALRWLDSLPADRVVSSDSPRALETAQVIAGGRTVASVPALRGLDLGDWEGRPLDAMPGLAAVLTDPNRRPPNGESLADVLERTRPAFDEAIGDNDAIVVAHRMVNAVLLASIMQLPLASAGLLQQDPGGINLLERRDTKLFVHMINVNPLDPIRSSIRLATLV